jgi:hypothetical protein
LMFFHHPQKIAKMKKKKNTTLNEQSGFNIFY